MPKDHYRYCSECGDGPTGPWMNFCAVCGSRLPPNRRSGVRSSNTADDRKTWHQDVRRRSPLTSKPSPAAEKSRSADVLSQATTTPVSLSVDVGLNVGDPVCSLTDRMDLPVLIAGKRTETMPDLGADVNAMSLATLQQLGTAYIKYRVPKSRRFFRAGDSEIIEPDFHVRLACEIPGLPGRAKACGRLTFYVFTSFMEGTIIIGRQTLRLKKIFTDYRHLLTPHKEMNCPIRKCLSISRDTEVVNKLHVYLNGVLAEGVADTGCYQLVMREDYAQELDLHKERVDFKEGESRIVVFASGREQVAEYKVIVTINATSAIPTIVGGKQEFIEPEAPNLTSREAGKDLTTLRRPIAMELWVFRTLLYPLILNQELLMSMKVFEKHVTSLRSRKVVLPELCPIVRRPVRRKEDSLEDINDRERAALRDLELERQHLVRELNEAKEDGNHEKQTQKQQKLDGYESGKQKIKQQYESDRQKLVGSK